MAPMRGVRWTIALSLVAVIGCASGSGQVRPPIELPQPSTLHQCVLLPSTRARAFHDSPGYEQFEVSVLDPTSTPPGALWGGEFLLDSSAVLMSAEFAEYVPKAPASVAILIDTSGNAENKLDKERDFAGALLRNLEARDDVALLVYSRRGYLLQPMTSDRGGALGMLPLVKASGSAALYDAAAEGLKVAFNSACYARRSLVIISSGFDNASHITAPDLIENARAQGVAIYFVGIGISDSPKDEREQAGLKIATRIVADSGGQIFPVGEGGDRASVESIARQISANMRGQYVVGFVVPVPNEGEGSIEIDGHPEYLVVSKRVAGGAHAASAAPPAGAQVYHSQQYHGVFIRE